jgi:N-acyl-D-aspartate/D-glutamate deacylase
MSKTMDKVAFWLLVFSCSLTACARTPESFDLVLRAGRVIDPETGLDAVRDVGIRGDTIARVSVEPLSGSRVIEAKGLVVAPGFIDLHQHQHDPASYRLKAFDGVTTSLELETGVPDVTRFIETRRAKTPIHFGATASHEAARVAAWDLPLPPSPMGPDASIPDPPPGPATNEPASEERLNRILGLLGAQLDAGALGIGVGLEYTPGATRHEFIEVSRLAAKYRRPVFIHVRSAGRLEPGSSVESLVEVVGAAAATGAAIHVVHVNSSCLRDAPECLALVEGARARGLDVTVEAYPYGVGATFINSAFFNPGWRERRGLDFEDLELPASGQRLSQAQFDTLHAASNPQVVLIHNVPDDVVDTVISHPLVMIASDGMQEHPRGAGTFARILSRYVREQKRLSLLDAVKKMSLMPAQRLETATRDAHRKGRIQEGADADIVLFNLEQVQDRSTFRTPMEPSIGVRFLIVAGTLVIDDGRLVDGAVPGRGLTAHRN